MSPLDEKAETLAQEFTRLVSEYRKPDTDGTQAEAWNLIADFAVDNADAVAVALRAYEANRSPRGEGESVAVKALDEIDLNAPSKEPSSRWTSTDLDEAFNEGNSRGWWEAAQIARSALAVSPPQTAEGEVVDEQAAVAFYTANPRAALFDLKRRLQPAALASPPSGVVEQTEGAVEPICRQCAMEAVDLERLRESDKQFQEVWNWLLSRGLVDNSDDEWPGFVKVIEEHEREIEADARRAPHPAPSGETGLLDALARRQNWELDWGPRDKSNENEDYVWRVHARSGGVNDREWTLIGSGETPADALRAALKAGGER